MAFSSIKQDVLGDGQVVFGGAQADSPELCKAAAEYLESWA